MKKIVFYNFIKEQASIVYKVLKISDAQLVDWFSYPPHGTINIKDFADAKYNFFELNHISDSIISEMYKHFPVFMDMHQRRSIYGELSFHDCVSDFHVQLRVIYNFLISKKPDFIIFGNIPHGGHDYLLYQLAKYLNINNLILFQIPIINRFFIINDIETFGSNYLEGENQIIDLPEIMQPIYMKNLNKTNYPLKKMAIDLIKYKKGLYSFLKRKLNKLYLSNLKEIILETKLAMKYVYFPLHLQPEMTTSSLGGYYVDQILAIEMLSNFLPDNYKILIKENPKQTELNRGSRFFERIKRIPNAIMVPLSTNTYELIKSSVFVATVTGTAGWEAINLGKPVLIFGKSWYQDLPGVFKYDSKFDFEKIASTIVNRDFLEINFKQLMLKSWRGVLSTPYFKLENDFDLDSNNTRIAEAISHFVQK